MICSDISWHNERALNIAAPDATQIRAAAELGCAAAMIGIHRIGNPFAEQRLADAWLSGWLVGNDGGHE